MLLHRGVSAGRDFKKTWMSGVGDGQTTASPASDTPHCTGAGTKNLSADRLGPLHKLPPDSADPALHLFPSELTPILIAVARDCLYTVSTVTTPSQF